MGGWGDGGMGIKSMKAAVTATNTAMLLSGIVQMYDNINGSFFSHWFKPPLSYPIARYALHYFLRRIEINPDIGIGTQHNRRCNRQSHY